MDRFIGYEYKEITVSDDKASFYIDCYENFGWEIDDNVKSEKVLSNNTIRLKRDRKIINKMELTRLQRHFEACANEISMLEKSINSVPTVWALVIGIIGTAFMAGATFAVTAETPQILLCIILAIPGFIGWIVPYFVYRKMLQKQTEKIQPLIEEKYDEVYEICHKGHGLL